MTDASAQLQDLETSLLRIAGQRIGIATTEEGVRQIRWLRAGESWPAGLGDGVLMERTAAAIRGYFAGQNQLADLPLDLSGISPFRRQVMEVLRAQVPPGEVVTYGELACLAGRPGAARAVGSTMSNNPLPLLVPCHRVVASNGPGGFGPGLQVKRDLLRLEGGDLQI